MKAGIHLGQRIPKLETEKAFGGAVVIQDAELTALLAADEAAASALMQAASQ